MLLRPYTLITSASFYEQDVVDLQETVKGLSKLFIKFLYKHSTNSADIILNMLITHMKHHYEQPTILEHLYSIRFEVSIKNC